MIRTITTFRNPIASIWQHAIHKAISQKQSADAPNLSSAQPEMSQFECAFTALQSGQPIPQTDSDGSVIGDCAKLAAQYVWAETTRDTAKAQALEDELRYS